MQFINCHHVSPHAVYQLSPRIPTYSLSTVTTYPHMQFINCHHVSPHAVYQLSPRIPTCSLSTVTTYPHIQFINCHHVSPHAVYQLSPRVPTCSFCHSLSCMSVLFTLVVPYSCLSLYIPLRSVSFLHSKCFPDCYCYGYAVPHSDHSCVITFCLSISFLFLNQYVLIPFVIVSFTFLRIIKTFLASVSKFRLFSLYNLRCISPYFLMLCLSYCCPFDLERFAVFCYHFDISYIFAETRNGKRVFSMVMASLCFTCATVTPSHRSTVTHLSFYHTLNFLI